MDSGSLTTGVLYTAAASLCLRLGLTIVSGYKCLCGFDVAALGHHGLSCRLGSGRQARPSAMNGYLSRLFQKANIPTIKEPAGVISNSNNRPDGYTLVPWSGVYCNNNIPNLKIAESIFIQNKNPFMNIQQQQQCQHRRYQCHSHSANISCNWNIINSDNPNNNINNTNNKINNNNSINNNNNNNSANTVDANATTHSANITCKWNTV
ncbi:hypothetical protein HELRODRAFT_178213 [Helobdella robusta]|uniref:Uncharacterized protein n=1 Tax=Helobdella robusta TaxID=6412 RepID=T1FCY3_HELRO|nr:hypothetical protein HELRODRAFT_178213 [Helobdella robusta]ESN97421.1 hypothetical protein HELRODRAFT_178213 [Helobdella robusta]